MAALHGRRRTQKIVHPSDKANSLSVASLLNRVARDEIP